MKLDGIHHITAITGDGQRCLDFYCGLLGLGLIGPDEAPGPDELRFADQLGRPRAGLGFLVRPGIKRGRPGAGMVHTISWRVEGRDALGFWAARLAEAGIESEQLSGDRRGVNGTGGSRNGHRPVVESALRFTDPEGLAHELVADHASDEPLQPSSVLPPELALRGLIGVRAYSRNPTDSADLLAGRLGFAAKDHSTYLVAGRRRQATYAYDAAPTARGKAGAGTVHHVAWGCDEGDQRAWRQRVIGLGARATRITRHNGRHAFRFREPSGVLFEIATAAAVNGHAGSRAGRVPGTEPALRAA